MKVLNGNSWKALLLLSIIVPVSLLTTFKLTGLLGEPATIAETITREPVTWEFEKCFRSTDWPLWFYSPDEVYVNNSYTEGSTLTTFAVIPFKYGVNYAEYEGSSVFRFSLNATATITDGFIEDMRIVFKEDYNESWVRLDPYFYEWGNLTLRDWAYRFYGESKLENTQKAFIDAYGEDHPREAAFHAGLFEWILKAPENVSQQLEITAEVTYFNGTSYVKVVLPILIRMIADIGNTFETARTINPGNYTASLSAYDDDVDCYKTWLAKNQKITIMAVLRSVGINLTLYDVNEEPRTSVAGFPEFTPYNAYSDDPKPLEEITYTADVEGYWYIKVAGIFDEGIYLLTVRVEP